jgi:hypothetical protein
MLVLGAGVVILGCVGAGGVLFVIAATLLFGTGAVRGRSVVGSVHS